ncbi:MAG: hypothetical protein QOI42_1784 [Frankiaceae bacterium]|nr:hypothetical protein [Frankiaceae bacterium]
MPDSSGQSRLRTYRRVPAAALLGAVLAYTASFAISPKYVSDTHLLINGTTSYLSSPGSSSMPVTLGSTDLATAMADTQAALSSSHDVAEAVVAQLKLDDVPPKHHGFLGSIKSGLSSTYKTVRGWITYGSVPKASKHDALVAAVQHALLAAQVKTSYVLDVAVVWDDPKVAAAIANAAADALVAQSKQRYADEVGGYQTQLKNEVDKASQAQAGAQQALSDYEASHHITDVSTQLVLSAQNRSALQQQAGDLAAQLSSLQAQLASTQQSLATTPKTIDSSQRVDTGRGQTSVSSTGQNPTYASLMTQVASLRAQIDGVAAQRDAIVKTLSATVENAKPLTAAQSALGQLVLTSTVAAQNYSTLSAQYQQSLLNAGQHTIEISHIDTAAPPLLPASPIRTMYIAVGLLVGALLSFLVVHAGVLRRSRAAAVLTARTSVIDLVGPENAFSVPPQAPSANGHHVLIPSDAPPHDPLGK